MTDRASPTRVEPAAAGAERPAGRECQEQAPPPRVSAVVITFNEETRLRRCLESAAWVDEIVVVDAGSEDRTVHVAREFTDRVTVRPWPGFAAQKNFALDQARGEWVLSLDADEEVSRELRADVEAILARGGEHAGYVVPRRNVFLGQWIRHGGLYPDWQLRLFRRGRGRFDDRAVHESVRVDGSVGRLSGHLLHTSYRDVADFIARAHRYAALAAEDELAHGRRASTASLVVRPLGRFLSMYLVHGGFLDGRKGLLLAGLYAYYVFIRTATVWERTTR